MSGGAENTVPPLRERMPDYVVTFVVAGSAAAVIGAIVSLLTDASLVVGAAYGLVGLGVLGLLTGGATGGGYTNIGIGAIGSMFGGRFRTDEVVDDDEARSGRRRPRDPMERLRRGLRPAANPRAFWQVIGGGIYVAVGVMLLGRFG